MSPGGSQAASASASTNAAYTSSGVAATSVTARSMRGTSGPPTPDHDGLADGLVEHRQLVGRSGRLGGGPGGEPPAYGLELGEELLVAGAERVDLQLERHDPAHALDPDPGTGEVGDLAQPF